MNPQECVWEIRYHEDHIAGKGENSVQHYNLVHKFIPMPQAMRGYQGSGDVYVNSLLHT